MADSRHPFANNDNGSDELAGDIDLDEDALGEENATDTDSLMDETYDEEDERYEASVRKSSKEGITVHQYIKHLTDDQYLKMIGKDAYTFLSGHKDDIYELLTVGRDVADEFKTLNADDVKDVYAIIINKFLNEPNWTSKDMSRELRRLHPELTQFEADRIIRTETTRIIDFAREYEAKREGLSNYYYGWMGPLDYRTTPMCYYLQTGTLRDSDRKALKRAGSTESDLPIIPKEGLLLEDLRKVVEQVAECFGYDMISDWVPHINCRHTFVRGNRALEPELPDYMGIVGIFEDIIDGTQTAVQTEEENDVNYIQVPFDMDSLIFLKSIYDKPTMFDGNGDYYYVFEDEDEQSVFSTARMVVQLMNEGLTIETIIWAVEDITNMDKEDVGYIVNHAHDIVDAMNPYM